MHENAKEHLWKYNLIATILCAEKCCDLCPTFYFVKKTDLVGGVMVDLSQLRGMWRMWGDWVAADCTHCREIRQVVSWVCSRALAASPSLEERSAGWRSVRVLHEELRHGFLCVFPVCLMCSSGPGPVSCVWWVPGPGPQHKDNTPWEPTNISGRSSSCCMHQDSFKGFSLYIQTHSGTKFTKYSSWGEEIALILSVCVSVSVLLIGRDTRLLALCLTS